MAEQDWAPGPLTHHLQAVHDTLLSIAAEGQLDAVIVVDHHLQQIAAATTTGRRSGDRRLPPPYDKLSAAERETWLILEAVYDGSLTPEVQAANSAPMVPWAELKPEVQQSLGSVLLQVVPMLHAVALNPAARVGTPDPAPGGPRG